MGVAVKEGGHVSVTAQDRIHEFDAETSDSEKKEEEKEQDTTDASKIVDSNQEKGVQKKPTVYIGKASDASVPPNVLWNRT